MDDIFTACREGKTNFVRQFLDNIENDLNEGDDHGFTPLHWAAREGKCKGGRTVFWIKIKRFGKFLTQFECVGPPCYTCIPKIFKLPNSQNSLDILA